MTPHHLIAALLALLTLGAIAAAPVQGKLKPADVPEFAMRFRVTSVDGQAPAADKRFSFHPQWKPAVSAAVEGGAWSTWMAADEEAITNLLGRYPNLYLKRFPLVVKVTVKGVSPITTVEAQVRFGTFGVGGPGDDAPGNDLKWELFGGSAGLLIFKDGSRPVAQTMAQYNRQYWKPLQRVNLPEPRRPEKLTFIDRFIGGDDDRIAWSEGVANLSKAGFNAIMLPPSERHRLILEDQGLTDTSWAIYNPPGYAFDFSEEITSESIQAWADKLAKPFLEAGYDPDEMRVYAMSDEPGWYYPSMVEKLKASDEGMTRFRQYLQEQNLTPETLGVETWDQVEPITREEAKDLEHKRRFYWSMRFFSWDSSRHFAQSSQAMRNAFAPSTGVFTNWNFFGGRFYVPGPVANNPDKQNGAAAMGGHDWFEFGRMGGGDPLWTEDWFNDAKAPQWSYYMDRLRIAAEYGNVSYGGYVIPRTSGQRENGIVQKIMAIFGHGGKTVKFFVFGPEYNFPGNCYSHRPELLAGIAKAGHMAAKAEELLYPGRKPNSEVAILFPRSSFVWDLKHIELPTMVQGATNTHMTARRMAYETDTFGIYTAYQHANRPIDFIDETAALDPEQLDRYKIIYVTQPNLPWLVQQRLVPWIRKGGHLVLTSGAAAADEYNEPTDTFSEIASASETRRDRMVINDLRSLPILGTVQAGNAALEIAGGVTSLRPTSAKVLAVSEKDRPAITNHHYNSGRITRFAFQPGVSYLRSWSGQSQDHLPVGYSQAMRNVIIGPAVMDDIEPPVKVNVPLVETPILRSDKGAAVTVLNWTGQSQNLDLTVKMDRRVQSVESVTRGRLRFRQSGDTLRVALPVGDVDVVLIHQ